MKLLHRLGALALALCLSATAHALELHPAAPGGGPSGLDEPQEEPSGHYVEEPSLGESGLSLGYSEVGGIVYPTDFTFTIDPFQSAGDGQVYSQPIVFVNDNPFPVCVELTGLLALANDAQVALRGYPIPQSSSSGDKEINLWLIRADESGERVPIMDTAPGAPIYITLGASDGLGGAQTAADGLDASDSGESEIWVDGVAVEKETLYSAAFELPPTIGASGVFHFEGAVAQLEITGSVNPMPRSAWRAGDVTVSMILHGFAAVSEDVPGEEESEESGGAQDLEEDADWEPEAEKPDGDLTIGESGGG